MGMSPIHPNLLLMRPMTRGEFLDALEYEGMFGFGPMDAVMAHQLEAEGRLEISELHGHPTAVWIK